MKRVLLLVFVLLSLGACDSVLYSSQLDGCRRMCAPALVSRCTPGMCICVSPYATPPSTPDAGAR